MKNIFKLFSYGICLVGSVLLMNIENVNATTHTITLYPSNSTWGMFYTENTYFSNGGTPINVGYYFGTVFRGYLEFYIPGNIPINTINTAILFCRM